MSQNQDANTRSCRLSAPSVVSSHLLLSLRYDRKLRSLAPSRPPGQTSRSGIQPLASRGFCPTEEGTDLRPRGTGTAPPADPGAFQADPLGVRDTWPRAASPREDQRSRLCPGPGHRPRSPQQPTGLLARMWSPGPTSVLRHVG